LVPEADHVGFDLRAFRPFVIGIRQQNLVDHRVTVPSPLEALFGQDRIPGGILDALSFPHALPCATLESAETGLFVAVILIHADAAAIVVAVAVVLVVVLVGEFESEFYAGFFQGSELVHGHPRLFLFRCRVIRSVEGVLGVHLWKEGNPFSLLALADDHQWTGIYRRGYNGGSRHLYC